MKKLFAVVMLSVLAVGGVASARSKARPTKVSDAQVQAAIDARLHQMLQQLNDRHGG